MNPALYPRKLRTARHLGVAFGLCALLFCFAPAKAGRRFSWCIGRPSPGSCGTRSRSTSRSPCPSACSTRTKT